VRHFAGEPVRHRGAFGLDALLSAAELLCFAPPAICSLVCAARLVFSPSSAGAGPLPLADGRLLVRQYLLLVGTVAIGSLIRRRQSGGFARRAVLRSGWGWDWWRGWRRWRTV